MYFSVRRATGLLVFLYYFSATLVKESLYLLTYLLSYLLTVIVLYLVMCIGVVVGISYFLVVFADDRFHVVHTAVADFDVILVE